MTADRGLTEQEIADFAVELAILRDRNAGAPSRVLEDGRTLNLELLLWGVVRLTILRAGGDEGTYDACWDYPTEVQALVAMQEWDGINDPPDGWTRSLPSNRRRVDGDPKQEFIRP